MDLLQLRYFLKLAEHQHVTKTANILHISQPALSSTIKKLENELGAPLFERNGRNIVLSAYGEIFRTYVEEAFLSLENGKQAIARKINADSGSLNIGILSPYVWNDLFALFDSTHPEVRINRRSIEDLRFVDQILSGEIDFYLGGLNQIETLDSSRLQFASLYEDEMVLLVHANHPLASRKSIDLRECAEEHFISLAAETNLQQFIDHIFAQAGFTPKVVMTCDYTLRDQMVAAGHGVSVTTKMGVYLGRVPGTVPIPLSFPTEKRKLGLVWRKNRVFSNTMETFYETARAFYADTKIKKST